MRWVLPFIALVFVVAPRAVAEPKRAEGTFFHDRYFYVARAPELSTHLGLPVQALHWAYPLAYYGSAGSALYATTQSWGAVASYYTWGLFAAGAEFAALGQSHLAFRRNLEMRSRLRSLQKQVPGLESVHIVTPAELDYRRLLPVREVAQGIAIFVSDRPIERLPEGWGEPIRVDNTNTTRIHLGLELGGEEVESWDPTIEQILNREPMPQPVAKSLQDRVMEFEERALEKTEIRMSATLVSETPTGTLEEEYGTFLKGKSVKQFVGVPRAAGTRLYPLYKKAYPFYEAVLKKVGIEPKDAVVPVTSRDLPVGKIPLIESAARCIYRGLSDLAGRRWKQGQKEEP